MLRKKARGFEPAKNFNCANARQQAVLVDKARAALLQSRTFHAKEILMAEPVLMEKEADVTTITLNRPESGNRQTDATRAKVT